MGRSQQPRYRGTRPRWADLCVYVTPEERERIEQTAAAAGLSLSAHLRSLGETPPPKPVFDPSVIAEMATLNEEERLLGQQLKEWLVQPAGTAPAFDVESLLALISEKVEKLSELANRLETSEDR